MYRFFPHSTVPAIIISFFHIGNLPIVKDVVRGLITEFDIKANVLVSIALIASTFIGEVLQPMK